jgi:signal transduction histidine kinase/CheY-like chemotaxis protein
MPFGRCHARWRQGCGYADWPRQWAGWRHAPLPCRPVNSSALVARTLALVAAAWAVHLAWTAGLAQPWLEALRWLLVAGLSFAAVAALGWHRQQQTKEARAAAATGALQQRLQDQATELAATRQQMHQALEAAEAAAQAKSSFLAAASHDLRQPAHALGLYTAALRAGPLAPEQAEIASRMQASLAALDTMFAALMDVSRMDAGAVAPQWDTVSLAPLLHRLAVEWAPQAEARGLRLAVHVSDPLAVTVTDPLLLERVLRNLLANAVKYTQQGGVLLACRARTATDGALGWRVEVWDTGIGIAPAERERVFEEFYQVANPGRERGQGLGLGLAIVQRLVRLLQLRLVMHSVPGRGSVFLLSGLASAGPATQRAAVARQAMRQLEGLGVAVLEDDADVRDAMRRLLTLWGCEVLEGTDAQDLLRRSPVGFAVNALIADVRLAHGHQGPDEARALAAAWGRAVPVLLVSGETGADALQALQQAGHQVLAKPVSPARLRTWLESVAAGLPTAQAAPPNKEESHP